MNRREVLRLLAFTGVCTANLGTAASFFTACARRRIVGPTLRSDRYGITIMVDGWRADMFKKMLDAGELPNIKKHLIDRGTIAESCIGTFPSTTGPAHLPFITGIMPGYNNLPGLRWVDRFQHQVRDYCTLESILFNNDFPQSNYTLYEVLTDERTTCIFDFASRGAREILRVPLKMLWFVKAGGMEVWGKMDQAAVDAFTKVYLGAGVIPRYTFVWMPAIDHLSHFHGSLNEVIHERAQGADRQVGHMMEVLQKAGIYDKTLISLVADHGLRDTERHLDIRSTLMGYGFKVLDNLSSNDQYNSLYQNNAARGVSGNAFALLYFATQKKGRLGLMSYAWDRSIEYDEIRSFPLEGEGRLDLINLLRNENGIQLVMVKEKEDVYRIFSKSGEGRIEREYATFRYTVTGSDPLGYSDNPNSTLLMDGAYHSKDDWFAATTGTNYPDGLFHISQVFDSHRCGDIVISSELGYDFFDQGHIASHGGIEKAEMMVPCVIAGPGVKQGVIAQARTVDIYPTYLKFLGIPNYDGEILNVFL